jgi:TB2/DP1, HVA22 family
VYGFLGVLDPFAGFILYWIPFFSPLKLAFLVWCWAPTTKGKTKTLFTFYMAVLSLTLTNVVLQKDDPNKHKS